VAPALRDPKSAQPKMDFTVTLPSFGNPFAGLSGAPAAPAAAAAPAVAKESGGFELAPLLLLFSPLLIVQFLSAQTVVRLGTQAIEGAVAPKK
jgi:hypothetical protein